MNSGTVFAVNVGPTVITLGNWTSPATGARSFIEVELLEERCIDGIHRPAEDERIAVRGSPDRCFGREIAACAWSVLDDDRLMKLLRHPFGNNPGNDIEIAARGKADQQAHGTGRVAICPCKAGNRWTRGNACSKAQKLSAWKLHGALPGAVLRTS